MSAAINLFVGLEQPVRGRVVGGPDCLPTTYYYGAPGWTDSYFSGTLESDDRSIAACEVVDAMLPFEGRTVTTVSGTIRFPLMSETVTEVDLPVSLLTALSRSLGL